MWKHLYIGEKEGTITTKCNHFGINHLIHAGEPKKGGKISTTWLLFLPMHAEFAPGAIHSEWCHSDVRTWLNITYLGTQEVFKSYFLQNQVTFIILHTSLDIKNNLLYKANAVFNRNPLL